MATNSYTKKNVYFVLFDHVQLLDVSGPAAVLSMVNSVLGEEIYNLHYVSENSNGHVVSNSNMRIFAEPLPTIDSMDMLIVPGALDAAMDAALQDAKLMTWLASLNDLARIKVSVCMGTFFFAQLGWLNGKRATTHWAAVNKLQKNYPEIRVMGEALYQQDGDLWSSGGVTSGIDMMLALVTKDFGLEVAIKTAKLLVVYLLRDGRQSQFSIPLEFQTQSNDQTMITLIAWLEQRLHKSTSVKDMADFSNVSVRKLHNLCQQMFDIGPAQLLSEMRMENARAQLLKNNLPIKEIAFRLGFSQPTAFSKAFSRRYGIAPIKYRDAYRSPE